MSEVWHYIEENGELWYNIYYDQPKIRLKTKISQSQMIPHYYNQKIVAYDIKVKQGTSEQVELMNELGLEEPKVDKRTLRRGGKFEA